MTEVAALEAAFVASSRDIQRGGFGPQGQYQQFVRTLPEAQQTPLLMLATVDPSMPETLWCRRAWGYWRAW